MGRPSQKDQLIQQVKKLYVEEEMSLGEIRTITGKSQQTLSRWLQSEGVAIVSRPRNPNEGRTPEQQAAINAKVSANRRGKGTGPRKEHLPPVKAESKTAPPAKAAPPAMKQCHFCQNSFVPTTRAQMHCDRRCARGADAARKSEQQKAVYVNAPKRCSCGTPIPYEVRHSVKYCSQECRKEYGSYREKDPENYLTFACLGCGKEVTRLKKYSPYTKYCSNRCAARHTKTKKHIVVDDAIVLDSAYEALLWGLCGVLKLSIKRYDREQGVEWREGGWYAPDFLITCHGGKVAVETKGFQDSEDEQRWAAFRAQSDVPLVVLTGEHLLGLLASREELLALLGFSG
ncbi:hypothetical protein [Streptomyces sp. NPDC054838]